MSEYDPAIVADYDQEMAFLDNAVDAHMTMLKLIKMLPGSPTDDMTVMGLLINGITQATAEAEKLPGGVTASNLPKIYARLVFRLNQEMTK